MAFGQVGQGAKASGKAGELAGAWWNWALANPADTNPLIGGDPDYSEAQCDGQPVTDTKGKKWFLGGSIDGSAVERTCTVPVGAQLFYPVVNIVCVQNWDGETEEELRNCSNGAMDQILNGAGTTYYAKVDDKDVPAKRVLRAESPGFTLDPPDDNIFAEFGLSGDPALAVADGLWVTLPPLSKGEHKIEFGGNFPAFGFAQQNTYNITVECARLAVALSASGSKPTRRGRRLKDRLPFWDRDYLSFSEV